MMKVSTWGVLVLFLLLGVACGETLQLDPVDTDLFPDANGDGTDSVADGNADSAVDDSETSDTTGDGATDSVVDDSETEGVVNDSETDGVINDSETEDAINDSESDDVVNDSETDGDDTDSDTTPELIEEICDDGIDNDGDGLIDCADPDCDGKLGAGGFICEPFGETICDDGFDNDGNGLTDCPTIGLDKPAVGMAVAGNAVQVAVQTAPNPSKTTFQCRVAHVLAIGDAEWQECGNATGTAFVYTPSAIANDGLTQVEVRYVVDGQPSESTATPTFYVHNSLNGAVECPQRATDQAYFDAAESIGLPATGPFPETLATANPFIQLPFSPIKSGQFQIHKSPVAFEVLSLRKRFHLSDDGQFLLVTRTHKGRRTNGCFVIQNHKVNVTHAAGESGYVRNRYKLTACEAVVLNSQGAAVCLVVDSQGIPQLSQSRGRSPSNPFPFGVSEYLGAKPDIDYFMWRRLMRAPYASSPCYSDEYSLFSRKCWDPDISCAEACAGGGSNLHPMLYLPDHQLFFP
ncbi:MAG: hypothetical protein M0R76_10000 [Proteobacteria bacterium]|nr:hypothetical protein [Pseudomonadota bacterium]